MTRKRTDLTPLSLPEDDAAANWIAAEVTGELGSVTSILPSRFDAYVRVFHPVTGDDGFMTWTDVALELDQTLHATTQWHELINASDTDDHATSAWAGGHPERGSLAPEVAESLCRPLAEHTCTAENCLFALWTGWKMISFEGASDQGQVPPHRDLMSEGGEVCGPRFELPPEAGREYVLLTGPLWASVVLAEGRAVPAPGSANFLWPADRSWCLATDIDFDSTLVGGSNALVEAILEAPDIEALQIGPNDSLLADKTD